jgi:uncharacterized protein (TIGR01777 family)
VRVVVAGGSGLVGRALVDALRARGDAVCVLTRGGRAWRPDVTAVRWLDGGSDWQASLAGADAVVNLAGEPVAGGRWTAARKRRIMESRVATTRLLVEALGRQRPRPARLVNASAVGVYGTRGDEELTEDATPGDDFLARVCLAWEAEARRAAELGVAVAVVRLGVVLARAGGALPRLALPVRLFCGGPLGSGRQWVPWIHRADVVGILCHLLDRGGEGAFNAVSPQPVRNLDFTRAVARALRRPCWRPVPAALLRAALGEMAAAMLLGGQRAVPARILAEGYRFRYPTLDAALADLLSRPTG